MFINLSAVVFIQSNKLSTSFIHLHFTQMEFLLRQINNQSQFQTLKKGIKKMIRGVCESYSSNTVASSNVSQFLAGREIGSTREINCRWRRGSSWVGDRRDYWNRNHRNRNWNNRGIAYSNVWISCYRQSSESICAFIMNERKFYIITISMECKYHVNFSIVCCRGSFLLGLQRLTSAQL